MEEVEFRKFAEGLRVRAEALGACPQGMKEWDSSNEEKLIKLWKRFIDFGIGNNYPTLQEIDRFDAGLLSANGIWVDHEFSDGNWELPEGGIIVLNGTCTGVLRIRGYRAALVYVRHTSDVRIETYDHVRCRVYVYDDAVVNARHYGIHKIYLTARSETCEVMTAGNEVYRKLVGEWE